MIVDHEFLEHHGVRGMKWGQRRSANRQLNKAHKEKQKAAAKVEFDKNRKKLAPPKAHKTFDTSTKEGRQKAKEYRRQQIDRARERINSGAMRADHKDAKSKYRTDKAVIGSKAAKEIFKSKKAINVADVHTAQQIRDGKELTGHIIGALVRGAAASAAS